MVFALSIKKQTKILKKIIQHLSFIMDNHELKALRELFGKNDFFTKKLWIKIFKKRYPSKKNHGKTKYERKKI